MKKILFFFAAAAVLAACTRENAPDVQPSGPMVEMTFEASASDLTKAGLDDLSVVWSAGDKIAIFDGISETPNEFTLVSGDGSTSGIFTGSLSTGATDFYAVYPFDAAVRLVTGETLLLELEIPAQQAIPDGQKVDPKALVAVSKAAGDKLQFHNVVSLAKVSISDAGVKYFSLTPASVGAAPEVMGFDPATGEFGGEFFAQSYTASCAGSSFAPGDYYLAVLPGSYEGINLIAATESSKALKSSTNTAVFRRSGCLNLGDLQSGMTVAPFEIHNASELQDWAKCSTAYSSGDIVTIVNDIDMSGVDYVPATTFVGTLDGQEHVIKNWISSIPLLNILRTDGELKDIKLASSCVLTFTNTLSNFGFVVANNRGKVSGVSVEASASVPAISSDSEQDGRFGLVVGNNAESGSVLNCTTTGSIDMSTTGLVAKHNLYLGAVIGRNAGYVSDCTNSGAVNVEFTDDSMTKCLYAAGICGHAAASGIFEACINIGDITIKTPGSGEDCLFACGVVGFSGARLIECNNSGAVSVISESSEGAGDGPLKRACAAGVAGYSAGELSNCENSGDVILRGGYSTGCLGVGDLKVVSNVAAGVVGLVYNAEVNDCTNSGDVSSTLLNIDNAKSDYNTNTRATVGGIIGNLQGTATGCTNSGKVDAYWVTSSHSAGLSKQFVAQGGGISGGSYNSVDKKVSSIIGCTNTGILSFTCDATGSNNAFGGIVGWPGSEPSNGVATQTGSVSGCTFAGQMTIDGFGKTRAGGISGGACTIDDCSVKGTITIAGKTNSAYIGGVIGYQAAGHTLTNTIVDGLTIDYTNSAYMNGTIYGIGGLIGLPQNYAGFEGGAGCSVLVTIKSNHCRDIGFIAGRVTNTVNTMVLGAAGNELTIKKGCSIVNKTTNNTVSVESEADLANVISSYEDANTAPINYKNGGFLIGSLNYEKWNNLVTLNLKYSE
ncbi:MAG: hypothetical protein J6O51_04350 [Bacteroidales bacterium]|nr:hypothetical protein [Bacteroidales bacterium]